MARPRQANFVDFLDQGLMAKILTHMPLTDAVRTSVLCKNTMDSWKVTPKIVFKQGWYTQEFMEGQRAPPLSKMLSIMQDILMRHYGGICEAEFIFCGSNLDIASIIVPILAFLSQRYDKTLEKLTLFMPAIKLRLPTHLSSLKNLKSLRLRNCVIGDLFIGASRFEKVTHLILFGVDFGTPQQLQQFLGRFPVLNDLQLSSMKRDLVMDQRTEGTFTFCHLVDAVPNVSRLVMCQYYVALLATNVRIPEMVHVTYLHLHINIMDSKQLTSALSLLGNSRNIVQAKIRLFDGPVLGWRTPTSMESLLQHQGLNVTHLRDLEVSGVHDLLFGIKFVEVILRGSANLRKARVKIGTSVNDEESEKLRVALLSLNSPCTVEVSKVVSRLVRV